MKRKDRKAKKARVSYKDAVALLEQRANELEKFIKEADAKLGPGEGVKLARLIISSKMGKPAHSGGA